jgi:hypothetical protein
MRSLGRAGGGAKGAGARARAGTHPHFRARGVGSGEFAAQKSYYNNPAGFSLMSGLMRLR